VKEITEKNKINFGGFTDDATELLMNYHWPGNIRQLRNIIESMIALEKGKRLSGDNVRKYLSEQTSMIAGRNLPVISNRTVEQAERELIYRALVDLKSNIIEMKDILNDRLVNTDEANGSHIQPQNGNGILTMDEMERRMISTALNRNKGSRRLAARELSISERTLYRKIKDYGLQ
jgi:DNA-binding NtrC family response regulator